MNTHNFNIANLRWQKPMLILVVTIITNTTLMGCTANSAKTTSDEAPIITFASPTTYGRINNINTNKRFALIIGNTAYTEVPELRNPINDAKDLADVLRNLGFEVEARENVKDSREMRDLVVNFGNKLRRGGVGLFYYSGHGIQVNGENYLIPTTASLRSEADAGYEALGMSYVQTTLDEANNGLNIIILDACRDNPFTRSMRRVRSTTAPATGLAQMNSAKGSLIAFSTSPGSTAEDGSGRNGTYTKYLLANIKKPGLTVESLFKQVRIGVTKETNGKQTPWESTSLTGEFCFAGCQDPTTVQVANKAAQATAEEERLRTERLRAETETIKKQQSESLSKHRQEKLVRQEVEEQARKEAEEKKRLQENLATKQAGQESLASPHKANVNNQLQDAIAKAWQRQQARKQSSKAQELRNQQLKQEQQVTTQQNVWERLQKVQEQWQKTHSQPEQAVIKPSINYEPTPPPTKKSNANAPATF